MASTEQESTICQQAVATTSIRDRDEKLKLAKERRNQERQRKIEELKAQAEAALRYREKKEEERRRRLDEQRMRDDKKRQQVEERKRAIMEAEKERCEYILRKNQERESRLEAKKRERSVTPFAFGSSTPRLLDSANFGMLSRSTCWGQQRRSASISNVAVVSSLLCSSSEGELHDIGANKRSNSTRGLDRDDRDNTMSTSFIRSVARRKTDLMPTIPTPRDGQQYGSRSSLSSTPRNLEVKMRRENKTPYKASSARLSTSDQTTPKRPMSLISFSSLSNFWDTPSDEKLTYSSPKAREPNMNKTDKDISSSFSLEHTSTPKPKPRTESSFTEASAGTKVNGTKASKVEEVSKKSSVVNNKELDQLMSPATKSKEMSKKSSVVPKSELDQLISPAPKTEEVGKNSSIAPKPELDQLISPATKSEEMSKSLTAPKTELDQLISPATKSEEMDKKSSVVSKKELDQLMLPATKSDQMEKKNSIVPKTELNQLMSPATKSEEVDKESSDSPAKDVDHQLISLSRDEIEVPTVANEIVAINAKTVNDEANKNLQAAIESQKAQLVKDSEKREKGGNGDVILKNGVSGPGDKIQPPDESTNNLPFPENDSMTASMIARNKISTEEEAKAALAEKRRLMREELERKAELERIRIEEEKQAEIKRQQEEAERQRRLEEESLRLVEEQRRAEEARLRQAIEEAKQREEEEKRRLEEEERQRLEREEAQRKLEEEEQKQRIEVAERLEREEKERQERRKRVEAIMSRTRKGAGAAATTSSNSTHS